LFRVHEDILFVDVNDKHNDERLDSSERSWRAKTHVTAVARIPSVYKYNRSSPVFLGNSSSLVLTETVQGDAVLKTMLTTVKVHLTLLCSVEWPSTYFYICLC